MLDDIDRKAIDAAIASHCEWLETQDVRFSQPPDQLEAAEVISAMQLGKVHSYPRGGFYRLQLARSRMGGERKALGAWTISRRLRLRQRKARPHSRPNTVLDIVVESLRSLCALRTRAKTAELRRNKVAEADALVESASAADRRRARLLRVAFDDEHLRTVDAGLEDTRGRLRTSCRKLSDFTQSLADNHRTFVDEGLEGLSGAPVQMAMARTLVAQAARLEENIEIFRRVIQGASAERLSGHVGAADGKAWHRLRADALLWLKQVRAHYSLGQKLFPDLAPRRVDDVDAQERARKTINQAVRRAKKRSGPRI